MWAERKSRKSPIRQKAGHVLMQTVEPRAQGTKDTVHLNFKPALQLPITDDVCRVLEPLQLRSIKLQATSEQPVAEHCHRMLASRPGQG